MITAKSQQTLVMPFLYGQYYPTEFTLLCQWSNITLVPAKLYPKLWQGLNYCFPLCIFLIVSNFLEIKVCKSSKITKQNRIIFAEHSLFDNSNHVWGNNELLNFLIFVATNYWTKTFSIDGSWKKCLLADIIFRSYGWHVKAKFVIFGCFLHHLTINKTNTVRFQNWLNY